MKRLVDRHDAAVSKYKHQLRHFMVQKDRFEGYGKRSLESYFENVKALLQKWEVKQVPVETVKHVPVETVKQVTVKPVRAFDNWALFRETSRRPGLRRQN